MATVIVPETVNNPDWTLNNTGSGLLFTSTTSIPANGRSRIAIKVKAIDAGAKANTTVNITPTSGGETFFRNNIAVLSQSVQN